ncbi:MULTISPECIES: OB-fold nucleic acid binding domain-containing protein [Brevibacterium]|jgi:hypothetical protein|uniref:OB-fold nucleic acid binding domain-containing protein n=1 Tax=Brevibacterium casei TaxID=33889 RepID=A0A7T3ZY31_9MICO|nr:MULTISPECIES: OB-fold nucleic acid binding domain-containing protein [Brevibacterium]QQB13817.1 OB-fold nucleic acid binding domain-containing protein [Brevibacterium casei]
MLDLLSRLTQSLGSRDDDAREDLRMASRIPGVVSIGDVAPRAMVRIAGVVSAVTRSTNADNPRLTITVSDGTGDVEAQFLGRREISGIRPGALLVLEGRFCDRDGVLAAHNPVYELVAPKDEHE